MEGPPKLVLLIAALVSLRAGFILKSHFVEYEGPSSLALTVGWFLQFVRIYSQDDKVKQA